MRTRTRDTLTTAAHAGVGELGLGGGFVDHVEADGSHTITLRTAKLTGEPCSFTLKFPKGQVPSAKDLREQFRQMAHDFLYGVN